MLKMIRTKGKKVTALLMGLAMCAMVFIITAQAAEDKQVYSPQNLLINPGFEETQNPDEYEGNTFKGWNVESDATTWSTLFPDGPARTGTTAGTTWCESDFNMSITQEVEVVTAGKYEASVWIARGKADFGEVELRILQGDTLVKKANLAAVEKNTDSSYYGIEVRDMDLVAGNYIVEIFLPCTQSELTDEWKENNAFARVDDVYFGLQDNNVLINPSFDEIQDPNENDGNVFVGWNVESDSTTWSVLFADKPARTGAYTGTTWCESDFNMSISQDVVITEAGNYNASVWVARGAANYGEAELRVKKGDNVVATGYIAALGDNDYYDYMQILLENVELATGEYILEIYIPCTQSTKEGFENNAWARVDNAYLGLQATTTVKNILLNGSFEETQDAGANEGNLFVGWDVNSDAETWSVLFGGGQARTGKLAGITWCESDFNMSIAQKATVVDPGEYTASVWISHGAANFPGSELRILQGDKIVASAALRNMEKNTDTQYKQIVIPYMNLEAGEVIFEIYIPSTQVDDGEFQNNAFARVDDAFLAKINTQMIEEPMEETKEEEATPAPEEANNSDTSEEVKEVAPSTNVKNDSKKMIITVVIVVIVAIAIGLFIVIKKRKTTK